MIFGLFAHAAGDSSDEDDDADVEAEPGLAKDGKPVKMGIQQKMLVTLHPSWNPMATTPGSRRPLQRAARIQLNSLRLQTI